MPHSYEDQIVIVGGGIAGLALGRVLQAKDIPYRIVERRQNPWDGGLAVNLPGNAIQALIKLGLGDQIEQIGHPLRRREYRTARDKLLFKVDEDAFWGAALHPRSIRRSALLSMLSEGLPHNRLLYDVDVQSISENATRTELVLQNETRLSAALVVGADGVHSKIRSESFGASSGSGKALLADRSWRFMAPNPGVECWTVWAGADGMMLLMPVGDGEVYGWAALTRPTSHSSSIQALDCLTREFPERARRAVMQALARPSGLYHSPLEEVRLDCWHKERVVLIGDAAHATAPIWAEGVALALEDAIVLGETIATNSNFPAALSAYESRRRPRVAHVQAMTDAMSRAAKLPPLVRNLLVPFVGPKQYRQTYEPLKAAI
ncbi:FAD-dependent oxidoreductase [Sphingomonas sp. PAMC 26605]|uniref:FAD-dependent oxidoreductase n=1 Tax=Sphingomonas sp. PAMC 26605 TaxID=1112214 RepID=UPI00026CB5BB|nr:NAD(P)/FAD-dependent oxidoreductase [Sphingomonas sp. PAMC 26605]